MEVKNERELNIVAVGDLLVRRKFYEEMRKDPKYSEFIDTLDKADIAFGNLEAVLCTRGYPYRKPGIVRGDPEIADDLTSIGFDVLSLANNHALDYGAEGLFEMLEALDRVGIRPVGAGKNLDESLKEVVIEVKGKLVGFLAFSSTLAEGAAAGPERPGMAPIHVRTAYEIAYPHILISRFRRHPEFNAPRPFYQSLLEEPGLPPEIRTFPVEEDLLKMQRRIKEVSENTDFLLVSVHWGIPYYLGVTTPDWHCEYETTVGHSMIDAGADVVIGHHPHRIHGIEVYKKRPIMYSVGNCISTPSLNQSRARAPAVSPRTFDEGRFRHLMLHAIISEDGDMKFEIMPIRIDENGYPFIAIGKERQSIVDIIKEQSSPYGTNIYHDDNKIIVQI